MTIFKSGRFELTYHPKEWVFFKYSESEYFTIRWYEFGPFMLSVGKWEDRK